jgi:hypothetical protein
MLEMIDEKEMKGVTRDQDTLLLYAGRRRAKTAL